MGKRKNPLASAVPGGYVRRTGPTSCRVSPMAGMLHCDYVRLRDAAKAFARHVPYGVDVSLDLWGMFIERNTPTEQQTEDTRHMAAFLQGLAVHFPDPQQRGPHATTF